MSREEGSDPRWVLATDGEVARMLVAESPRRLRETEVLARRDVAHRPVRLHDPGVESQRLVDPELESPPQSVEFARVISGRLEQARQRGDMDDLVIVSPVDFVRILKPALTPGVASQVSAILYENLVDEDVSVIGSHLPDL